MCVCVCVCVCARTLCAFTSVMSATSYSVTYAHTCFAESILHVESTATYIRPTNGQREKVIRHESKDDSIHQTIVGVGEKVQGTVCMQREGHLVGQLKRHGEHEEQDILVEPIYVLRPGLPSQQFLHRLARCFVKARTTSIPA